LYDLGIFIIIILNYEIIAILVLHLLDLVAIYGLLWTLIAERGLLYQEGVAAATEVVRLVQVYTGGRLSKVVLAVLLCGVVFKHLQ
jgi:hypothetical protein